MNIQTIKYNRNIENMGNLFVFFEIQNKIKNTKSNNHFLCRNNENKSSSEAKTPLDLAVFPLNSQIEYISFFIENKKLLNSGIKNKIIYTNYSILITDKRFNVKNKYIDVKMEFNQYIQDRDIFVISKTAKIELIGYRIDDDHYTLFDEDENFSGVVFKNLTDAELEKLKQSNVI